MTTKNILKSIGILAIGMALGWLIFGLGSTKEKETHDHEEVAEDQVWTCSMHPQIRQSEPGDCPICGMDLIPLETTEYGEDPAIYTMSENAMKLANVQTTVVQRKDPSVQLRLNGKVQVDERNSYSQSTHIPGRIEQLFINFTGEKVYKGQTLATVYSPELVTAQEELLQAYSIKESQPELFEAAKDKLRNWKISERQIERILAEEKPLQRFAITADVGGIVTKKMIELGDYVDRGMAIYEITDLSKVWVLFDLYERQIEMVKEGSIIEFTISSLPGKTFEGKITFIDPLLDPQTRVATARVEVNNAKRALKPGMFASGVVKDTFKQVEEALIIPKSAVLWTGTRSVVYVREFSGFKMREIVLGAALGDSFLVEEGLNAGEEVVSHGAFTIDAAVQLSGQPSMMNPSVEEDNTLQVEVSEKVKEQFFTIVSAYLELKESLAGDNFEGARQNTQRLQKAVKNFDESAMNQDAQLVWKTYREELGNSIEKILASDNIDSTRDHFIDLSNTTIGFVKTFEIDNKTLYIQYCPMANKDKGAEWLSLSTEIKNPYYGDDMLTCGEVRDSIK